MAFFSKRKRVRGAKIPFCSVVIAAAGASKRMGGEDKLFFEINGAPVLAHTLSKFQDCGYIEEIIVVTREDCFERVGDICKQFDKASKIIVGGQSRLASVINGVYEVSKKAKLIAIHDGARPCIDIGIIERTIEAAARHNAAAPAVPVSSTLKRVKRNIVMDTVDRDDLYEIQTPQVFNADLIKAALTNANRKSIDVTDDCKAVEMIGATVHITEGSRRNIKLTTKEDIVLAEATLNAQGVES